MLGTTHVAIGIATSLAILQPDTIPGCLCAVVGGGVGGWICDIDGRNNKKKKQYPIQDAIFITIVVGLALVMDFFVGNGIYAYVSSHLGIKMAIAGLFFVALCIYGVTSPHRSFMHSLLALVLSSICTWFIYPPLVPTYAIGFGMHILLDLFNKRGLQLFWPYKRRFCFGTFYSDRQANKILLAIGTIAALVLLAVFSIRSLMINPGAQIVAMLNSTSILRLPTFLLYILIINVVTFIAFTADYFIAVKGVSQYVSEGETASFLNILGAIGGSAGMLLAVLIWGKGIHQYNIGWAVFALSFTLMWGGIIVLVYAPLEIAGIQQFSPSAHVPFLTYLFIVNVAEIALVINDRKGGTMKLRVKDFLFYLLSFLGGAIGGYAAMMVTGSKMKTGHAAVMPILVIVNIFLLFIVFFTGVV